MRPRSCPQWRRRLGALLKGVLICWGAVAPQPCFNPPCPAREVPASRWAAAEEARRPLPEETRGLRVGCGASLGSGGGNAARSSTAPLNGTAGGRLPAPPAALERGRPPAEPAGGRAAGCLPGLPALLSGLWLGASRRRCAEAHSPDLVRSRLTCEVEGFFSSYTVFLQERLNVFKLESIETWLCNKRPFFWGEVRCSLSEERVILYLALAWVS